MKHISDKLFQSPDKLWNFASSFSLTNFLIIKFFAEWCYPCKIMEKKILSFDLSNVTIINVDVDKFPSIAKSKVFSVSTIPTLFVIKNGKLLAKIEDSSISEEELKKFLVV